MRRVGLVAVGDVIRVKHAVARERVHHHRLALAAPATGKPPPLSGVRARGSGSRGPLLSATVTPPSPGSPTPLFAPSPRPPPPPPRNRAGKAAPSAVRSPRGHPRGMSLKHPPVPSTEVLLPVDARQIRIHGVDVVSTARHKPKERKPWIPM